MALYELLADRLDFADDPSWGQKDVLAKVLTVAAETTFALETVYESLRGTAIDQAEVVEALVKLWNEKIVPLDLPVGPVIEAFIDKFGDDVLASLVPILVKFLETHIPAPTPE